MINANQEVLSFHIYMWNMWSKEECALVFNDNPDTDDWVYTLGHHIWNKWIDYCDKVGATAAPSLMIRDLDSVNLDKLVKRACELYNGRKLR